MEALAFRSTPRDGIVLVGFPVETFGHNSLIW